MGTTLVIVVVGFLALMVGLQVWAVRRARALTGQPLPALPGRLGGQIPMAGRSLLYFFSPSCGACRAITPKMKAMRENNPAVFLVDVSEDMDLARALNVMATPSLVEIADGRIANYHIGMPPPDLFARY